MNEAQTICGMFDRPRLTRLKAAYDKAVTAKEEAFVFDNDDYLVSFAKYLIEHLENVLS